MDFDVNLNARTKKSIIEKSTHFQMKIKENHEQKHYPKHSFCSLALSNQFWEGLGWVLGGFWEGFGAFLASLGPLLDPFLDACILNALQKGPWRLLGWILVSFGGVWEGFVDDFFEILDGFWKILGRVWRVKNYRFFGLRFFISRSGCWCFWRGFDQRVRKNTNKYERIRKSTEKYNKI